MQPSNVIKIKISDAGRGTYFNWNHVKGWDRIIGRITNSAGLYTEPKLYKIYSTSNGIYVNVTGYGRIYL